LSRKDRDSKLVYSSDGSHLPRTRAKAEREQETPSAGTVRVQREKKGRRGKTVTVVTGLPGDHAELREVAGELKRACGTGGAVKDGSLEIQGDHVDDVIRALAARGVAAKRSGG
jgi:translation initiation factor 1